MDHSNSGRAAYRNALINAMKHGNRFVVLLMTKA
jgi:hypothetical protein